MMRTYYARAYAKKMGLDPKWHRLCDVNIQEGL